MMMNTEYLLDVFAGGDLIIQTSAGSNNPSLSAWQSPEEKPVGDMVIVSSIHLACNVVCVAEHR
jgi:hypothetical protein